MSTAKRLRSSTWNATSFVVNWNAPDTPIDPKWNMINNHFCRLVRDRLQWTEFSIKQHHQRLRKQNPSFMNDYNKFNPNDAAPRSIHGPLVVFVKNPDPAEKNDQYYGSDTYFCLMIYHLELTADFKINRAGPHMVLAKSNNHGCYILPSTNLAAFTKKGEADYFQPAEWLLWIGDKMVSLSDVLGLSTSDLIQGGNPALQKLFQFDAVGKMTVEELAQKHRNLFRWLFNSDATDGWGEGDSTAMPFDDDPQPIMPYDDPDPEAGTDTMIVKKHSQRTKKTVDRDKSPVRQRSAKKKATRVINDTDDDVEVQFSSHSLVSESIDGPQSDGDQIQPEAEVANNEEAEEPAHDEPDEPMELAEVDDSPYSPNEELADLMNQVVEIKQEVLSRREDNKLTNYEIVQLDKKIEETHAEVLQMDKQRRQGVLKRLENQLEIGQVDKKIEDTKGEILQMDKLRRQVILKNLEDQRDKMRDNIILLD